MEAPVMTWMVDGRFSEKKEGLKVNLIEFADPGWEGNRRSSLEG